MIERKELLLKIERAFASHRIVCLLGPRQCGKTTIAREFKKQRTDVHYFDLERPSDAQVLESPDVTLPHLSGLIVMDEIQRIPNIFPYLRYLHDENLNQQFLILGSASRDLLHQSAESLAGRIVFIEIHPLSLFETRHMQDLWVKGGFPRSYLLDSEESLHWRENYMRTYVEQDLRSFGVGFDTQALRRLWMMLAHYHGQTINYADLSKSLSTSQPTLKKYVTYLENSFMVRLLKPWFANLKKRQVKSPKVYYRDIGLLHYVLNIRQYKDIFIHPKAGASWEGFAMEELIKFYGSDAENCYFWGSHNKAELDLLLLHQNQKLGFEFKLSDAPKLTPSLRIAMDDLEPSELTVIYPGTKSYKLAKDITVCPLMDFMNNGVSK